MSDLGCQLPLRGPFAVVYYLEPTSEGDADTWHILDGEGEVVAICWDEAVAGAVAEKLNS